MSGPLGTTPDGLVRGIRERHGRLDGILHAAGVIRDSLIENKTPEQISDVIAPKVHGLRNLVQAAEGRSLDFLVLFSSIAVLGNTGQADYAYANRFLDAFAEAARQTAAPPELVAVDAGAFASRMGALDPDVDSYPSRPDDPAIFLFSGGTTGHPKAGARISAGPRWRRPSSSAAGP